MNNGTMWTPTMDARLRELWLAGVMTKEIGEIIGMSKNSVIGRAHRIGLSRPSPIGVTNPNARRRVKRAPRQTLQAPAAAPSPPALIALPSLTGEAPSAAPAPIQPRPFRQARLCCWPIGHPREKGFRFCEAPLEIDDRSYCAEHAERAYIRTRQPAELHAE